jgi:hypothetical protein
MGYTINGIEKKNALLRALRVRRFHLDQKDSVKLLWNVTMVNEKAY